MSSIPGVSVAAAVGLPDPYSGEVPMLFVQGKSIDSAALADFMADTVSDAPARPRAIEIIDEIPLTPVGKIFKPRLREIAAERAVRTILADHAASVTSTVQAITDPDRGLIVNVRLDGDPAAVAAATRALGLLPIAVETSGNTVAA